MESLLEKTAPRLKPWQRDPDFYAAELEAVFKRS